MHTSRVHRYGPLNRVEIKRNYAFVEFKTVEDAIEAQKRSHGTAFEGRTITVEFVESSRLGKDRCGCFLGGNKGQLGLLL